jgi:TPR repeat protein
LTGVKVARDYSAAAKWIHKAAENGSVDAQETLADLYSGGKLKININAFNKKDELVILELPQDLSEALKWYRMAATQGSIPTQINLGIMYLTGKGGNQDYIQAYMWFSIAASTEGAFHESALRWVEATAEKMTPDQIASAQQLTKEWMDKLISR